MSRAHTSHRGYTVIELLAVTTLIMLPALALGQMLRSSSAVERSGRVAVLGDHDLRSALLSVGDLLRNVPAGELGGFDAYDLSTRPTLRRITGAESGVPTLGESAYIEWRAHSGGRSDDSGGIYLVEGGTSTLLADKIEPNSFRLRRNGLTVVVELAVKRATGEGDGTTVLRGSAAVCMRND
jgi:hypothetical protein